MIRIDPFTGMPTLAPQTKVIRQGGSNGGGGIAGIVAGSNVSVDATDPAHPVISAAATTGSADTLTASDGSTVKATDQPGNFGAGLLLDPYDGGDSYLTAAHSLNINAGAESDGSGAFSPSLNLQASGQIVFNTVNPATAGSNRVMFQSTDGLDFTDGTVHLNMDYSGLTADRTLHFPDSDGTLATEAYVTAHTAADDQTAVEVPFTPTGNIGATTVQAALAELDSEKAALSHTHTKTEVGLGNVDNTSDANKPVSTAQAAALVLKADDTAAVHKTGNETIAGTKTFTAGITQSGGDVLLNNGGGGNDVKVYGNSLPMIHVRKFFDRIGFGINGTSATVDSPFDVNLDSRFRTLLALGDAGPDANKIFNVDKTTTTTSSDVFGFNVIVRDNAAAAHANTVFGGFINAQTKSGMSQNVTGLRGAKFIAQHNGTGTVTNAFGMEIQVEKTSSGPITNAFGLNVLDINGGSTTNYAIKTGLGRVAFGDIFMPLQAPTALAPAYVEGAVYYDTTLHKLRVGGATGWETITST